MIKAALGSLYHLFYDQISRQKPLHKKNGSSEF